MGRAQGPWPLRPLSNLVVKFMIAKKVPEAFEILCKRIEQDIADGRVGTTSQVSVSQEDLRSAASLSLAQVDDPL